MQIRDSCLLTTAKQQLFVQYSSLTLTQLSVNAKTIARQLFPSGTVALWNSEQGVAPWLVTIAHFTARH